MSKALVTGGTGFVGSHLIEYLLKQNISVKCLVRKTSDTKWLKELPVEYVTASLVKPELLSDAVKGIDYIFHIGGLTKAKRNEDFYTVNYSGTKNLLEAARVFNGTIKRFVYCSSQAAAGPSKSNEPIDENSSPNPVSIYGKSKLAGEEAVLEYKKYFPVTIVRPPSVFGPRDIDFLFIFKMLNKRFYPILGTENRFYNFIFVSDLVKGIYETAVSEKGVNQTFFLCDDRIYSWGEFINISKNILGKKVLKISIPLPFLYISAFFSDIIAKIIRTPSIFNLQKVAEFKEQYWTCTSKKAHDLINFKTEYTLEDALNLTLNWYKNNGYL